MGIDGGSCEARHLLDLLAPGEPVTFQTFGEGKAKGNRGLNKIAHGTLAEHDAILSRLNRDGAGVFWMVNAGDLRGRANRNVSHTRALFVDLDGAPLEPVSRSSIAPHAVVESSPKRWHAYWRIADCSLGQFGFYQKALANRFGGDPSVCDLSRVMRLPGFMHRKAGSFQSRIVAANDSAPYVLDDFHAAFAIAPYTETQEAQEAQEAQVRERWDGIDLARFVPTEPGQRQRNRCLFSLARHLRAQVPDATAAQLRGYVKQWHAIALPTIGTSGFSESWGDFARAWESVRHPEGQFMQNLMADVDADALPADLPDDYDQSTLRLVRVCGRLQKESDREPFFLSARTAGDLLGMHFTSAANLLSALVADGFLIRVSQGQHKSRQASEYRIPALHRDTETQETQETQVRGAGRLHGNETGGL